MAAKSIHLCCSVLVVCNHLVVKLCLQRDFLSADFILKAILSVIPVVWTLGPFLLWQSFEAGQSGPLECVLKHARNKTQGKLCRSLSIPVYPQATIV